MNNLPKTWQFIDEEGTFRLVNPHHTSYLYFPLANEAGMMSSITPTLNGDIKIHQNAFLTLPVSMEDLHNSRSGRNFWVFVDGIGPWSVTGNSAAQTAHRYLETNPEVVTLEAGFLWHKITRVNPEMGIRADVTNFVPTGDDHVELMRVSLTNVGEVPIRFTPTAAIPIYGRSADDLRDHRHVTSLLHRIQCESYGILVRPTLSFDERGHLPNDLTYAVLGVGDNGDAPAGFFPLIEDFIGEGGKLDWPEAIVKSLATTFKAGQIQNGYEAIGGLRFQDATIQPGESSDYVLILAILENGESPQFLLDKFGSTPAFTAQLENARKYWKTRLDTFKVKTRKRRFDMWMRWVSIQPTLRRLYGNSFLPAHDYGRGGRGWRDLWQDILALLLTETGDVSEFLYGNFAGVRIDGSNATIIGSSPGEFKADRNNIPRVWMDHGAWPLLTATLYIHQTGDLAFLLRDQTYFKDHLIFRSQEIDPDWEPDQGTLLLTIDQDPYRGTILEHILIQHLTPFYNVGVHNNILLEGADWNDGMDMAPDCGESVAFTALYASNLRQLSEWVLALDDLGVDRVELAAEIIPLLDTLASPVDYASVDSKHTILAAYYESVQHTVSGEKTTVPLESIGTDLQAKSDWLVTHIRTNEWIHNKDGYSWFNGYYDNYGQRIEGDHPGGVRMTLTGQVFTLMGGIATDEQARDIVRSADRYLLDPSVGGYRLNTDFGEVMLNLGRAFGFSFGHKENGAMFSHMAVMYANALYKRGLVQEGYKLLEDIYRHCQDFPSSRMYPGIPEYINPDARGMYTWLTGSASWYLLTMVTEVFGVRGINGDLILDPKLVVTQFDDTGESSITTLFANKSVEVIYQNPDRLDYGQYQVILTSIDGEPAIFSPQGDKTIIPRTTIRDSSAKTVKIQVRLGSRT